MDTFGGSKVGDFRMVRHEGALLRVTLVSLESLPAGARVTMEVEEVPEHPLTHATRETLAGAYIIDLDFGEA